MLFKSCLAVSQIKINYHIAQACIYADVYLIVPLTEA